MESVKWGIIGPGGIARWFANGVKESSNGMLLAVASRTQAGADRFAVEFGIPRRYGGYERLLADPDVDAVYIATPHPMHAGWAVKAAEAGKHILVEKPMGVNAREAEAIIDAARENDVFLMEAFMYRCHPLMEKLAELVRDGAIGDVGLIQSSFCFHSEPSPGSRGYDRALAGGGILDVGCYPVSISRLVAGAAAGKRFEDPVEAKGCGFIGETGVDERAAAVLKFPSGILAEVSCGIRLNTMADAMLRVFGSQGMLWIQDPWQPSRFNRDPAQIVVRRWSQKEPEVVLVDGPLGLYTYEAETAADNIPHRQAPAMTWDDSLGNIRVLDRWHAEIGLVFDMDNLHS